MKREPVHLRQRPLKRGGASLYLDIVHNGQRRYEYLQLYLLPENRQNKAKNAETMRLAETIKAKRTLELTGGRHDLPASTPDVLLYDYFARCMAKRQRIGGNRWKVWRSTLNILRAFEPREGLFLHEIDRAWCVRWVDFVTNYEGGRGGLAQNTAATYNKVLRAMFSDAVREGVLKASPAATVSGIGAEETQRAYLTAEEVARMVAARCGDEEVRKAFLFGCMTGLRRSDLVALRWEDIKRTDTGWRVELRQRKTKTLAYIDTTDEALSVLGERDDTGDGRVLHLPSPSNTARYLDAWVARAGIDKHITMHSARHTFATLLLTRGADIYTVSKLLGHRNIATTQIYGKIVDERRRAAVSLLDGLVTSRDDG